MVGVAAVAAVLAGCDPYSKATTAPPSVAAVTATSGTDATTGSKVAGTEAWTIDGAATTCAGAGATSAVSAAQPIVFVTFNKQMNPATVQTSVTDCTPTNGWLKVTQPDGTTPVTIPSGTAWYSCYTPSSPTAAEGGSAVIFLGNEQSALSLTNNASNTSAECTEAVPPESGWASAQAIDATAVGVTSVRFTGSVADKEGRALPIDVTVNYAPNPGTVRNFTASAVSGNTITLTWTNRDCVAPADVAQVHNVVRQLDPATEDFTITVPGGDIPYAAGNQSIPVTGDPATPASYAVFTVTTVPGVTEPFEQQLAELDNVVPGLPVPVAPTAAMSPDNKLPVIVTTGAIPAEVDDFDVYRASFSSESPTAAVGAFSRLGNVGAGKTTFVDVSALLNSRYVYKTVAVKTIGDTRARGTDSPPSASFITPPSALPTGTPFDVTDTSVTLEYPLVTGTITSSNVGLALERAPDNAGQPGAFVAVATKTAGTASPNFTIDTTNEVIHATDTTALADTTYWYRLVTTNSVGSAVDEPVSVTTLALAPPTSVTGTRSAGNVTVSWTASSPSTGVTGYTVERSVANACGFAPVAQAVTTTQYVDQGAPANVAYVVVATGANGKTSPPSDASPVVP
jgi:hypothetical protein